MVVMVEMDDERWDGDYNNWAGHGGSQRGGRFFLVFLKITAV